MIVVMKPDAGSEDVRRVCQRIGEAGLEAHVSRGRRRTVVGCVGDESALADVPLAALSGVEDVHPIERPYRMAARAFVADPTVIEVGGARIGAGFTVFAGPCSVEGREMLLRTARKVREAGGSVLRGGAFKPRTSPYSFTGLGVEGLELLAEARARTGLPVVTEVMDPRMVDTVSEHADILQIGARNMQNYDLLREVGAADRPVFLKRGMSATIRDLLLAAEYVMSAGNRRVILCERGIRTFGTATRNTLDIASVPVLKQETHLPVVVDPSHASGRRDLVAPLAAAAAAVGADGIMVEVHPRPEEALSDGAQSLDFEGFRKLMDRVRRHLPGEEERPEREGFRDGLQLQLR
ncbi:MAG: 3-deoxy-7-phosphoheptulonate synthase [Gemmatimonadota bacterium]